ncbi:Listeria/Bacterioides repeat [Candidatus Nanopelagicaceae bacterium]
MKIRSAVMSPMVALAISVLVMSGMLAGISTPAFAVTGDNYLPNECVGNCVNTGNQDNVGFFSSNAAARLVNDNNSEMLRRNFVKVGILYYKLNKSSMEAALVGYDHTISPGYDLVIQETVTVTLADITAGGNTQTNASSFVGTYTIAYIGRQAFRTNGGDSAPVTPMDADFSSISMPNTIKVIGMEAFFGQCLIRKMVIPDSVTDIGMDAFLRMDPNSPNITQCSSANVGLREIVIGSAVKRFYTGAFGRNTKLETITVRASSENFETPTATTYPNSYDYWQWNQPNGNPFITGGTTASQACLNNFYRLGSLSISVLGSSQAGWSRWINTNSCFSVTQTPVAALFSPNQPDSPTVVSRTLTSVTVNLSTHTADGGSPITNYLVTANPGGAYANLSGASGGNVVISGLTNSTSYTFKVTATNAIGESIPSISSASVTTLSPTRPNAPSIGVASIVDSQTASVAFSPPTDNGGSTINSFTVTSYPSRRSGTGSSSPILVTGLTLNNPETFTVTATNSVGTSDSSTASNVVTPKEVYVVTFEAQGGNSISSGSFVSGESVTAPASNPAKSGYTFSGWSIASSGGTQVTFPYSPGVTNNITLFAQWTLVPVTSTTPAPVVLGPPPSTFVVVANPKISRSASSYVCTSGTYKFKKQGGKEDASSITSQQINLLSNGGVVDSEKTLGSQSTFEGKSSYKGTTLSCEVGIKQEEVVKTYSSIDPAGIASYEAAMTAAIYGANTTYYSERDYAYMKRDAGDVKLWKEMLEKALVKREETKVRAGVDYLANLEKAGISLVVAADKTVPAPTPTPTPAPTKSPEVSVTGNVQPAAMKKVGTIYFASGTYFLNDESKKTIKALATSIFMKSPATVLSYGFTDSKGGTDNTVLSQNRAKAVAKLLRSLLPGQQIVTGWYASSKPVAAGNSKAALAKNRRVEIYIK